MDMITALTILKGGLVLGALYVLMATGLSLVWTTLGIFNFAHGSFIALGAYIAWEFSSQQAIGLPIWPAILITCVLMFAIGVILHILVLKPFERRIDVVLLCAITTLAGSTIIENALQLYWGPRAKQIAPLLEGKAEFSGISMTMSEILLFALVLSILVGFGVFLSYSKTGRSMRAVAQNRDAAQLLGMNIGLLYALALGLSAMTAGLAGIFVGTVKFMTPMMGSEPLMKALIVVIFGGVARFTSPIYGAFIIGFIEAISIYYVGLYWAPAVLFTTMIVVLLFKPEGLFGKQQRTL